MRLGSKTTYTIAFTPDIIRYRFQANQRLCIDLPSALLSSFSILLLADQLFCLRQIAMNLHYHAHLIHQVLNNICRPPFLLMTPSCHLIMSWYLQNVLFILLRCTVFALLGYSSFAVNVCINNSIHLYVSPPPSRFSLFL